MTAQLLQAMPFAVMAAPKIRAAYRRFLGALDDFGRPRCATRCPNGSWAGLSARSIAIAG
jgi:hypothetical protein